MRSESCFIPCYELGSNSTSKSGYTIQRNSNSKFNFWGKKSFTFGFNTSLSQRVEGAPIMSISMTSSQMLLPVSNKPNVIHYFTTQSWIQKQPCKRALMHINQFENLVNASAVNFIMISKLHKLHPKKKTITSTYILDKIHSIHSNWHDKMIWNQRVEGSRVLYWLRGSRASRGEWDYGVEMQLPSKRFR